MTKHFPEQPIPQWSSVYRLWLEQCVPEVEVLEFDLKVHHPNFPWRSKVSPSQELHASSPQDQTAYHLAIVLLGQTPEIVAAYKLLAYFRQSKRELLVRKVLTPVFESRGMSTYEWWHSNARYVIPYVQYSSILEISWDDQVHSWEEQVVDAAQTWTAVAREWTLTKIPRFLDRNSPIYREYEAHMARIAEQQEQAEYVRLRQKYRDSLRKKVLHRRIS